MLRKLLGAGDVTSPARFRSAGRSAAVSFIVMAMPLALASAIGPSFERRNSRGNAEEIMAITEVEF